MRITHREFAHAYQTYSFGYTLHGELEAGEVPEKAYEAGFLPASNDPSVQGRFYMARSIRVPLAPFEPSSENRRILKKFDGRFTRTILERDILAIDEEFSACFLQYFADRHGQGVMTQERLTGILATPLPIRVIRYEESGAVAGYVLEVTGGSFAHYWYSCYTASYAGTSFGMWLMLDGVRAAKADGKEYYYLGTAYGEKGRYKMNVSPLEFWDGSAWNADVEALRERIQSDTEREVTR